MHMLYPEFETREEGIALTHHETGSPSTTTARDGRYAQGAGLMMEVGPVCLY